MPLNKKKKKVTEMLETFWRAQLIIEAARTQNISYTDFEVLKVQVLGYSSRDFSNAKYFSQKYFFQKLLFIFKKGPQS